MESKGGRSAGAVVAAMESKRERSEKSLVEVEEQDAKRKRGDNSKGKSDSHFPLPEGWEEFGMGFGGIHYRFGPYLELPRNAKSNVEVFLDGKHVGWYCNMFSLANSQELVTSLFGNFLAIRPALMVSVLFGYSVRYLNGVGKCIYPDIKSWESVCKELAKIEITTHRRTKTKTNFPPSA